MKWLIQLLGYKLAVQPKNIAEAVAQVEYLLDLIEKMKAKAEAEARQQRERAERFLVVADKRERRAGKAGSLVEGLASVRSSAAGLADDDED